MRTKVTNQLLNLNLQYLRSSLEVFYKMDVKNFAKFTGKHLYQSLFLNKVAEKETLTQVFPCEFYKIFKNIFLYSKPPVATSSISWLHIQNLHYVKIYFSKILIKSSISKAIFFFQLFFYLYHQKYLPPDNVAFDVIRKFQKVLRTATICISF